MGGLSRKRTKARIVKKSKPKSVKHINYRRIEDKNIRKHWVQN